ncbi:hypothetical protein ACFXTN_030844 [Malus domestica]
MAGSNGHEITVSLLLNTQYDAFTLSPPIADENSSTEQVALTVPITDDPSLPTVTFWAWTLGALACALLSFLNQSF